MVEEIKMAKKTVTVEREVPCPRSCEWHGTNVLHRRHYERVPAEVVTLQEAASRLGLEIDWQGASDYIRNIEVAFNDRKCTNYFCGGEVVYAFSQVHKSYYGGLELSAYGICFSKQENGTIQVARPA